MIFGVDMPIRALLFHRFLVCVQVFVFIWFVFSPDLLPSLLKDAEAFVDKEAYAFVDNILLTLSFLQVFLCLTLWWPKKSVCLVYLIVTVLMAGLGLFSGPAVMSSIDAFVGYFQVMASGAMLAVLWVFGYFSFSTDSSRM